MHILLTAVLSVALHVLLGWEWTLGAAVAGGAWAGRRGWFVGSAGVALGWAALLIWNFIGHPTQTQILVDTLAGLAGNIPGPVLVGATVLVGAALGAAGGWFGAALRSLSSPPPRPATA